MKRALVPLAPGVEELEAVTLIDILRRAEVEVTVAGLDAAGPNTAGPNTAGPDTAGADTARADAASLGSARSKAPAEVLASRGVRLMPDVLLDDVLDQDFDLVVLPGGGPGSKRLREDTRILELLRRTHAAGHTVAAVCAAPTALDAAGLLSGKKVTSYPGTLGPNQGDYDYVEEPVVRDGNIVTSRGPGTSLDFALVLAELLVGKEKRDAVEAALMRP